MLKKIVNYSIENYQDLKKEVLDILTNNSHTELLESYKTLELDSEAIVDKYLESFITDSKLKDSILTLDETLLRVLKVSESEVEITLSKDLSDFLPKSKIVDPKEIIFYLGQFSDPKDRGLLSKYVTNVEGNVYALKNLPEEVVAVILSYVSRSPNTFRSNLLECLKDDEIIVDTEVKDVLSKTSDKASKFHEKWVLAYGHSSVSELSNVVICIDAVSILVSKQIEDNRLASYIEKSTRYQQFETNNNYHIPDELPSDLAVKYCDLMDYTFMTYNSLFTPVKNELKVLYPKGEKVSDKAYENSIHAKACDIIRYILPTSTYTSLGIKFNGRSAAQAISKLKSHVLKESQEIGMLFKNEALKILPTLVKYSDKNEFRSNMSLLKDQLTKNAISNKDFKTDLKSLIGAKIINAPDYQELITTLTSYIMYSSMEGFDFDSIKNFVKYDLSQNYKIHTIKDYVKNRGKFDSLPREFESIKISTEMVTDYGAFRDIQRHRIATPIDTILTTELGYSLHPDIEHFSKDIQFSFHNIMSLQKQLYKVFIDAGISKEVCQYLLSMAWNIRYSRIFNLRDLTNFLELRSGKQGHVSYRKVALDLGKELIAKYPLMQDILRLDHTPLSTLERLEAEIKSNI